MKVFAFILAIIMCVSVLAGCSKKETIDPSDDTDKTEVTTDEKAPADKDDTADTEELNEDNVTEKADSDTKAPANSGSNGAGNNGASGNQDTTGNSSADTKDETSKVTDNKVETDASTTAPQKNEAPESNGSSGQYEDGIVLEAYLYTLGNHFYKSYKEGDSLKNYDVLHLTAYFLLTQKKDCISDPDGSGEYFSVESAQLEKTMKLLFGSKASLKEQSKYMDESLGDKIDGDKYIFSRNRSSWGGSAYSLDYNSRMEIKEDDNKITAKVVLINDSGKRINITYTLKKVVDNGYLYFCLSKAKV